MFCFVGFVSVAFVFCRKKRQCFALLGGLLVLWPLSIVFGGIVVGDVMIILVTCEFSHWQ